MNDKTLSRLREIVGAENLTTVPEELLCYSYDGTGLEYRPEAVAFPRSVEEISRIMQLASASRFPVVPRGAGTGMSGGALPIAGGLVLAMSRLNRILEIDTGNQTAMVEPGVITGDFQEQVHRAGLFYPPDPASLKFCTIGGNVAECAGGPSAVKYGVTRDYVLGLEAVLPDGRIISTGVRTAKGVVGYDLTRLLVGSEGTLAIITKIILKLLPFPPDKNTFLVLCRDLQQATALVSLVLASFQPCTLEYLDRTALKIVSPRLPSALPPETEALLLIELDGSRESVESESRALKNFLAQQKGILDVIEASEQNSSAALWAARRSVSPAAFDLKPDKISEDVVVPRTRIPELVAVTEALASEHGLTIFTFGHAGDGNIHVNIMLDRSDSQEASRAQAAKAALFKAVLGLGGTLSGEHGVGVTKAGFISQELGRNSMDLMREIKKLFDPLNILNPGKIFPGEDLC